MYDKYFGHFLLNKGTLTADILKELLAAQQNVRVKLGMLAIKQGLMTGKQVEEVTQLQRTMDKKFGEIAELKGYLTDSQVGELLKTQSESANLRLSQAAIDMGYLSYEQLEKELAAFEKESGLSQIQIMALQNGDPDKIVKELLAFAACDHTKALCQDYVALLLRNIVRFLDEQPWLAPHPAENAKEAELVAQQTLIGPDGELLSNLYMTKKFFYRLASAFAKIDVTDDEEMAHATVGEFLNLHNGLFAVNMSEKNQRFKLEPPEILSGETDLMGCYVEIYMSFGCCGLLLGKKPR